MTVARERTGIEHRDGKCPLGQSLYPDLYRFQCAAAQSFRDNVDLVETENGVFLHLINAAAGNGVMGMVLKQEPPGAVEGGFDVFAANKGCQSGPRFSAALQVHFGAVVMLFQPGTGADDIAEQVGPTSCRTWVAEFTT